METSVSGLALHATRFFYNERFFIFLILLKQTRSFLANFLEYLLLFFDYNVDEQNE